MAKKYNMVIVVPILERDSVHNDIIANTAGKSVWGCVHVKLYQLKYSVCYNQICMGYVARLTVYLLYIYVQNSYV